MKRLLRVIILALLCAAVPFSAACAGNGSRGDGETGLILQKYGKDSFYTVTKYVEEDNVSELDISQAAKLKTGDTNAVVGRIKAGAFSGNASLTSIIVSEAACEEGLTIDEGAFKNMKSLEKITLPFVGINATGDAYLGETASAENKAVDKTRSIGWIFGEEGADYTAKVTLTYGSGDDASATFYIPATLKEITVESNAENGINIPMFAFCGLTQVYKINLKGNINAIGESAFKDMKSLTSVKIADSVKVIYSSAFKGTDKLKTFGNGGLYFGAGSLLEKIGDNAFEGTKLTNFVLPDNVTEIGEYCFAASSLKTFKFASGVTKVGAFAFCDSENLEFTAESNVPVDPPCTFGVWWNKGIKNS